MAKYRKKPIIIDAEIYKKGMECGFLANEEFYEFFNDIPVKYQNFAIPVIYTLGGLLKISEGDYIITGIMGERYPCKAEIFKATYEKIND